MANAAGWQPDPDPDRHDQERYWSGSAWTDRVRPVGSGGPADRAPDHVPQLHRAMSAAAADLDAVDDRISTLFERTEEPRPVRAPPMKGAARTTPPPTAATDDDIIELFEDGDVAASDDDRSDGAVVVDRKDVISEYEEMTSGTFADLDAELAAEEPDQPGKVKRRMFRRAAKGTTASQR
jgi:hypothetical protein